MKHFITTLIFALSVFYAQAQKTVNAEDLLQNIKAGKAVILTNTTIKGILDLTYMNDALPNLPKRHKWWNNGGSNTIEKQITNKVSFTNCTFTDDVLAYIPHKESGYTFIANFEDEVIFKDCTFEQKAMFKYSNFEQDCNFSNSKFNDDTTFKYAKFEKKCAFENTFFNEPATFKYAEFRRFISFANSIFKETTTFKYCKFKNGVSFNNVIFEEDLNLKYTKVRGDFDIKNMKVTYDIDSKYTSINGEKFSKYLTK